MMVKENKVEFIKKLQGLMNTTRVFDDLVIDVGYRVYVGPNENDTKFVPSTERLEWLMLRWGDQDPRFARFVPIDGDSCWGILIDFMRVAERM